MSAFSGEGEESAGALIVGIAGWLVVVAIFLGLNYLIAWLTYKYYKFELTENGFRKESGIIYKKYVTIPYDRIQNVDIYRGLLARILGLSDLNIQTAGASLVMSSGRLSGAGAEGRLPALSKTEAEKIRDELIARAKRSTHTGV